MLGLSSSLRHSVVALCALAHQHSGGMMYPI